MKRFLFSKWMWLLVAGVVLVLAVPSFKAAEPAAPTASTAVLLSRGDINLVQRGNIDDSVNFTGDLIPKEQTIISSEVDARINRVLVDEGQVVARGQALAELDTVDLSQAVNQQEAQLASAKAKLELDRQKMEKQSELLKQGFVSQIAYDELVTNYQASLQNYKAQEALLKRSRKQLADTHIVAPFAGVIYQKSVEPGQLALKNTKLFAIANLATMEIKAAIPSDQINRLKLGLPVKFKVETDAQEYSARVGRINQVAEAGTRSYMVYIDFDNHSPALKAGQFVKGQIIVQSLADQLLVPCDSLRAGANGSNYVLVLDGNKVHGRPVSVGLSNKATGICAVTGLEAKQQVISGAVLTVKDGDEAKVVD